MPARRPVRLALLLLAVPASACYTRAELEQNLGPQPLIFRALPYPTYDGDEGLVGNLALSWRKPPNRRPPPISLSVGLDARIATSGTRGALLTFDAPGWWRGWRVLGIVGAERLQRVPYYGVGNNAPTVDSLPDAYYRYALLRTTLLGTVHRRITRRSRVMAGAQWRHYRPTALGDTTLFAEQVAQGVIADSVGQNIVALRAGLMFDTRNEEASPTRGVFVEGMVSHAVSGADYTRWLVSAREFLPFGSLEQWVLGFRQTAELAGGGTVPLFVANERLTTWYPEDGYGGPTSLRLYSIGRFVAPNRTVFSADLRYKALDAPFPTSPVRVWLLGFADVGRLWNQGTDPSVTNLHWSVGIGGRLQYSKASMFGLDVGRNDEGFGFSVGTTFAF